MIRKGIPHVLYVDTKYFYVCVRYVFDVRVGVLLRDSVDRDIPRYCVIYVAVNYFVNRLTRGVYLGANTTRMGAVVCVVMDRTRDREAQFFRVRLTVTSAYIPDPVVIVVGAYVLPMFARCARVAYQCCRIGAGRVVVFVANRASVVCTRLDDFRVYATFNGRCVTVNGRCSRVEDVRLSVTCNYIRSVPFMKGLYTIVTFDKSVRPTTLITRDGQLAARSCDRIARTVICGRLVNVNVYVFTIFRIRFACRADLYMNTIIGDHLYRSARATIPIVNVI